MCDQTRKHPKKYLSPQEAVDEGYFSSVKQAAMLRSQRQGPPFFKPNGGRVVYHRLELEAWLMRSRVQTNGSSGVRALYRR